MINSITITNHLGESVVLELRSPEKSGFLVQNIDGLAPPKAIINTSEIVTNDGAVYNSARVNSRNIIFSLIFLDKPTIETTRQLSYKYFPIKKRVSIIIETDNRVCQTYGYIESNESNIFSKEEGCNISIICPDAYFYSSELTTTLLNGALSNFEFPFSNESLSEDLIEFGIMNTSTLGAIQYDGDADIGMLITLHFLGTATNIMIYNQVTFEKMIIDTTKFETLIGSPITVGDDIIISTVKGQKFIYLFRDGEYHNILNCLDRGANWFQLSKGVNTFVYTCDTGIENVQMKIENQIIYEGV